jgi:hypothetical protein
VTSIKTVHSRSNKDIGDVIEGEWEITAKKVIAEPCPGDRNRQAPRFGIYEYEVKPVTSGAADKPGAAGKLRSVDKPGRAKQRTQPSSGGTRREASSVPLTVRRTS